MANIDELATHWQDFSYDFYARVDLPDGDEVWMSDTFDLGLPILWLKHADGTIEKKVFHTPGYDQPTGEQWCFDCHSQMERHGDLWICPKCGVEADDFEIDDYAGPTEEASYRDADIEPEPEWVDDTYHEPPGIPHDEYDFEGF